MKVTDRKSERILLLWTVFLLAILLTNCASRGGRITKRLKNFTKSIAVVDTHEHQRSPSDFGLDEFNFYTLLRSSYLGNDLVSAGSPLITPELLNEHSAAELWDSLGQYFDYSANTSYARHLLAGMKFLYGYDEATFTEDGINRLSEAIAANYEDYNRWFDKAFRQSNFKIMFVDRWWDPVNFNVDTAHIALVFDISDVVRPACYGPPREGDSARHPAAYYRRAAAEGFSLQSLGEYLALADHLFLKAAEKNAVCLKNTLAYSRSLDFEDVPFEKAEQLYAKAPDLSSSERKALEDFMFHWIIRKSIKFDLPIQIHTGYFAGNRCWLKQGDPLALNNVLLQYPDARFVLFHGGYPWTGEFVAFGKSFSNVALDLVWLPQISRERAIIVFDEMLDCVPYNKIFWGGDCQLIEESTGALEFGQDVVIQVLAKRIASGSMSEEMAQDIIKKIFRENAINYFRLDEKLNIK